MPEIENHKELVPFEHYTALFAKIDPAEAAERCGVGYDPVTQSFRVRLLYTDYEITWPAFSIRSADPEGFALQNLPAQMLLIRYLLEGKKSLGTGAFLPYREMPWGEVYLKPFTGRCLNRAAFTFGVGFSTFAASTFDAGFSAAGFATSLFGSSLTTFTGATSSRNECVGTGAGFGFLNITASAELSATVASHTAQKASRIAALDPIFMSQFPVISEAPSPHQA